MSFRMFHSQTESKDLEPLKMEISDLLQKERYSSKYSYEANRFFENAAKLILDCDNINQIEKIVIGCITLAFITDDRKYGKNLSKYSYAEIYNSFENPDIKEHLQNTPFHMVRLNYTPSSPAPNDDFKDSLLNVADYVLKTKGCDDFEKTHFLKDNAFIASINKTSVITDQTAPSNPKLG